jgi:hypothetical protein
MHTRCARFPVAGLGSRCSVSGLRRRFDSGAGYQVPGARYPVPGTRYQALVFEKPAHGVCMMQDRNGQDSDYLLPGTWYLSPVPNSPISKLNKALLPYCLTALLPYCPTALLPYCLIAPLPYCRPAPLPYFIARPPHYR